MATMCLWDIADYTEIPEPRIEFEGTDEEKAELERIAKEVPLYCLALSGIRVSFGRSMLSHSLNVKRTVEVGPRGYPEGEPDEVYFMGCMNRETSGEINEPSLRFARQEPGGYTDLLWQKSPEELYEFIIFQHSGKKVKS
jgi:hypothetical protein